jgi:hypothetical protein
MPNIKAQHDVSSVLVIRAQPRHSEAKQRRNADVTTSDDANCIKQKYSATVLCFALVIAEWSGLRLFVQHQRSGTRPRSRTR